MLTLFLVQDWNWDSYTVFFLNILLWSSYFTAVIAVIALAGKDSMGLAKYLNVDILLCIQTALQRLTFGVELVPDVDI